MCAKKPMSACSMMMIMGNLHTRTVYKTRECCRIRTNWQRTGWFLTGVITEVHRQEKSFSENCRYHKVFEKGNDHFKPEPARIFLFVF